MRLTPFYHAHREMLRIVPVRAAKCFELPARPDGDRFLPPSREHWAHSGASTDAALDGRHRGALADPSKSGVPIVMLI